MAALDQPTKDILSRFQIDVNQAPAVTPALLAYLRGLGMDLSTAEDIRRQRISQLATQTTQSVADAEKDYGRSRQSTASDLIRRGVLQSGEASTRSAKLAEDQASRLSNIYQSQAEGTTAAEQSFSTGRDALRRAALEQLMGAEQSQAVQKATSEANTAAIKAQQDAQQKYYDQLTALANRGVA